MLDHLPILVSHYYLRDTFWDDIVAINGRARIMIDSGAFSNFGAKIAGIEGRELTKRPVSLKEYVQACKQRYHGNVWQYVAFDVVRNPEATAVNLRAMLDAGLCPMPVLVLLAEPELVTDLVSVNERVAVAGGVSEHPGYMRRRFREIYEASDGLVKIHGLGYARHPDFFHVPVASGDMSSWMAGAIYGLVGYYEPALGFKAVATNDHLRPKNRWAKRVYGHLIETCGVPPGHLMDKEMQYGLSGIPSLSYVSGYLNYVAHCREFGRDCFLAIANRSWLVPLFSVLENLRDGGFDYQGTMDTYARLDAVRLERPDMFRAEMVAILDRCAGGGP